MVDEAKNITDSIFNQLWVLNEGFRHHWEKETGRKEGQGSYGVDQVLHSMAAYLSSVLNSNSLVSSSKAGKRTAPKRNEMDEVNEERSSLILKVQHMMAKRAEAIKAARAAAPEVSTTADPNLETKEAPSAANPNKTRRYRQLA